MRVLAQFAAESCLSGGTQKRAETVTTLIARHQANKQRSSRTVADSNTESNRFAVFQRLTGPLLARGGKPIDAIAAGFL